MDYLVPNSNPLIHYKDVVVGSSPTRVTPGNSVGRVRIEWNQQKPSNILFVQIPQIFPFRNICNTRVA